MSNEELKELKRRLLVLLKKHAFKKGKFVLSSGKTSNYYLDGRLITLNAEGAYLTARIILDLIKDDKIGAIGGPTIGADPIVGAVAALSFLYNRPLKTFIIRKEPKPHGRRRQIEGPSLGPNKEVIIVDDVATTGKSFLEAIKLLRQEGIKVKKAIVIVDRQEGAKENLAKVGCKLLPIFSLSDFK